MKKNTKKIVGITIAIVMILSTLPAIASATSEPVIVEESETIETGNLNDTTQEDLEAQRIAAAKAKKLKKAKSKYIKKAKKGYKSLKSYMTKAQKKSYTNRVKKIKNAKTIKYVRYNYSKINKIFSKAKAYKKEHSYQGKVGVSCYGPYEGECTTATGRTITNSTYYVAVPVSRITSYASWKKMTQTNKRKYFYYHETVYLKNGSRTVKASVEDCGGFANMKSYGYYRLFDLTPAVFHALGISGIGTVSWHY